MLFCIHYTVFSICDCWFPLIIDVWEPLKIVPIGSYQHALHTIFLSSLQPVIIAKDGYPVETHEVVTKDGYILEVHRIPFGKNSPGRNRSPVLLMHGILSSSADWVLTGPEKGLGVYNFVYACY